MRGSEARLLHTKVAYEAEWKGSTYAHISTLMHENCCNNTQCINTIFPSSIDI